MRASTGVSMIYLFLGPDALAKDKIIAEIKQKALKIQEAYRFDFDILHAHKLDPAELKKTLISLPTIAEKRVVLIRDADKLSTHHQDILLECIEKANNPLILILDSHQEELKGSFFKAVQARAKTQRFSGEAKQSVFDMTNAIGYRKPQDALRIMHELIDQGDHPLQLMGVLVWFWGKSKNRVSKEAFKKGLLDLQEADLNIKRSRVQPEYALEILVTKLSSLIAL